MAEFYLKSVALIRRSNQAYGLYIKREKGCSHPKIVRELQSKDGNALIVVATCHWTTDIAWHNGNEAGSKQACSWWPQLLCQQVCRDGCQPTATFGTHYQDTAYVKCLVTRNLTWFSHDISPFQSFPLYNPNVTLLNFIYKTNTIILYWH
jgi:hypothetical protein